MDEYDDLDRYNGDAVHDMWVDFDSYVNGLPLCHSKENTGSPEVFDIADMGEFVDNLDDWD